MGMLSNDIINFFNKFGSHRNMVLSTSSDTNVHSRMMSIVCINKKFYFQTDKNFQKCYDISLNPNVALCIDNIFVEGICNCIGKPTDNIEFCNLFKTAYPKAYELYTNLDDEVLYEI